MLVAPVPNRFNGIITNLTGQPVTTWGTSFTPGNNTYPTYASLASATAYDTYFIELWFHGIGVATTAKDCLCKIGIDPAGGTAYTDTISHLIVSCAGVSSMGALSYQFPLFIPAGSTIGATFSVNNATVGTARLGYRLYGKPTKPELVRAGSYVDTFGATTATSTGTAITPGTASEGTVVTLGTNISQDYWWWQGGVGANNTALAGGGLYWVLDVGIGTSSGAVDWIFENQLSGNAQNTSEQVVGQKLPYHCYVREVFGDGATDVFARAQGSGTPDTGLSAIAYALGG